jgi:hypothetical protein
MWPGGRESLAKAVLLLAVAVEVAVAVAVDSVLVSW